MCVTRGSGSGSVRGAPRRRTFALLRSPIGIARGWQVAESAHAQSLCAAAHARTDTWQPRAQPRIYKPKAPEAAAAPPAPPPKAPPPPPPAPPKYTGPVSKPTSGKEAFDLVRTVVAEVLQVDPLSFSDKTRLLKDFSLTNEDAADIGRIIGDRGGITWADADAQTMRMSLLQLSLVEISHLVSDRAGVPRLEAWPVAAPPAGDSVDFV